MSMRHSVVLELKRCRGCTTCIKCCPTEAIRVWDGKAHILEKFCIDCGECVRTCSYHAKRIRRDNLGILERYDYTVALPPVFLHAVQQSAGREHSAHRPVVSGV